MRQRRQLQDPALPATLSRSRMEDASPSHAGPVHKLHVPQLYGMLPSFLQDLIQRLSWFAFLRPTWKPRYLMILGSYLYKFHDDTIKGSPIPLSSIAVAQTNCTIRITTLRKEIYYRTDSSEAAAEWVRALQDARHEAVRRSLGHVMDGSVPPQWKTYDQCGASLVARNERVRQRIVELEMNATTVVETGGAFPKGYYG